MEKHIDDLREGVRAMSLKTSTGEAEISPKRLWKDEKTKTKI